MKIDNEEKIRLSKSMINKAMNDRHQSLAIKALHDIENATKPISAVLGLSAAMNTAGMGWVDSTIGKGFAESVQSSMYMARMIGLQKNRERDYKQQFLTGDMMQAMKEAARPMKDIIGLSHFGCDLQTQFAESMRRALPPVTNISAMLPQMSKSWLVATEMNLRYQSRILEMRKIAEASFRLKDIMSNILEPAYEMYIEKIPQQDISGDNENRTAITCDLKDAFLKKMTENQYVCWTDWDEQLMEEIVAADDPEPILLREWEVDVNGQNKIYENLLFYRGLRKNKKLWEESFSSLNDGKYDVALHGFLAVLDGVLSVVADTENTQIERRINKILKSCQINFDSQNTGYVFKLFKETAYATAATLGQSSSFSGEEPNTLNRHWQVHGRSNRIVSKLDCVKIIRLIYGIMICDCFLVK